MKISNNISFGAIPKGIRIIDKSLMASGKLSWADLRALKEEQIGQIIDLRISSTLFSQIKEFIGCLFFGIKRKNIPVVLFRELPSKDTFMRTKDMVEKCQGPTLIHCNSGLHRTNLFCEALMILQGKRTIQEAEESLKKNGFFTLRNAEKRDPAVVKIQLETLHNRMDDFKKMFASYTTKGK